jgi:zinc protease
MKTYTALFLPLLLLFFSCSSLDSEREPLIPHKMRLPLVTGVHSVTESGSHTIVYEELENGLQVIIVEIPDSPVSIGMIGCKVGGRYEPESHAGISHLLEHLLFREGEAIAPVTEIRKMGGIVNALTDYELTTYYFTVLPSRFEEAMTALSSMVLDPGFDGKDLAGERKVVVEEIARGKNDPRALVLSSLIRKIFPDSPLKNLVIGTEQSVRRITLDDLYRFYSAYYVPANMVVVCAGDLDTDRTSGLIHSLFGSTAPSPVPEVVFETPAIAVNNLTRKIPVNQAFYIAGALSPGRTDDDYYPMMILDLLLGSGTNSRLYRRIVTGEGLTQELYPFWYTLSDSGIWAAMLSLDPDDMERVKTIVQEEVSSLRNGAVSDQEIEDAKQALIARELIRLQTPMEISRLALEALVFNDCVIGIDEHIENIRKVNRSDVIGASRRYFASENSITVTLVPAEAPQSWFLMLKILLTREL